MLSSRRTAPLRGAGYSSSMSDLLSKRHWRGWIYFEDEGGGGDPKYLAEAKSLGQEMASGGWGLVYGGTSVGLMGATADAVLSGGAFWSILTGRLSRFRCNLSPYLKRVNECNRDITSTTALPNAEVISRDLEACSYRVRPPL